MKDSQLFLILSYIVFIGCLLTQSLTLKIVLLIFGFGHFIVSRIDARNGK